MFARATCARPEVFVFDAESRDSSETVASAELFNDERICSQRSRCTPETVAQPLILLVVHDVSRRFNYDTGPRGSGGCIAQQIPQESGDPSVQRETKLSRAAEKLAVVDSGIGRR